MLVLTRKVGETIQIHTPDHHIITIRLNEMSGSQARIGIDAPAYYAVVREELLEQNNKKANGRGL